MVEAKKSYPRKIYVPKARNEEPRLVPVSSNPLPPEHAPSILERLNNVGNDENMRRIITAIITSAESEKK